MTEPTFIGSSTESPLTFRWPHHVRTYLLDKQIKIACMRCVTSVMVPVHDQPVGWIVSALELAARSHVDCVSYRGPR